MDLDAYYAARDAAGAAALDARPDVQALAEALLFGGEEPEAQALYRAAVAFGRTPQEATGAVNRAWAWRNAVRSDPGFRREVRMYVVPQIVAMVKEGRDLAVMHDWSRFSSPWQEGGAA